MIEFGLYRAHNEPIFQRLQICSFDKLYLLEAGKIMFEINESPDMFPLEHQFLKTKVVYRCNTRQSSSGSFSLGAFETNVYILSLFFKNAIIILFISYSYCV